MRRSAALTLLALLLAAALPAAKTMDYELTRAYDLLDRGEENRAKVLFRDYLKEHPDNAWAREGYEKAGGDLQALGLKPLGAAAKAKPAAPTAASEAPQPEAAAAAPAPESPGSDVNAPENLGAAVEESPSVAVLNVEPEGSRPGWLRRLGARLRSAGVIAGLALGVLLGVALLVLGVVLGLRLTAWLRARRAAQVEALAASPSANVSVELRLWAPWWGWGLDSEVVGNQLLQRFNAAGWTCVETRRIWLWTGLLSLPLLQLFLIALAQGLTLGFMRYYAGPVYLFRRAAGAAIPAPAPADAPAEA